MARTHSSRTWRNALTTIALVTAAVALSATTAFAQDTARPDTALDAVVVDDGGVRWSIDSHARFWIEGHNGLPVGERETLDDTTLGQQVIELGGSVGYDWFDVHAAVRLFSGTIFGGPPCLVSDPGCDQGPGGPAYERPYDVTDSLAPEDVIVPRALWIGLETPIGLFRIGHQTSSFGLGMLANDGEDAPDDPDRSPIDFFNDRIHGDLVERVLFVTRPGLAVDGVTNDSLAARIFVGLGGDLVYRDELASLTDGDLAGQGLFVFGLRPLEQAAWGTVPKDLDWEIATYSVYRAQKDDGDDADGLSLEAGVVDVYGKLRGALPGDMGIASVSAEAAWLFGSTNRVETEEAGPGRQVDVRSFGLASEVVLELPRPRIDLGVRLGYATGDANADDDTVYRFTFDRDFKAGLVMFDHVLAELSASARDHAIDPGRAAVPPVGIDELPTQGAIAGVFFLNPVVVTHFLDDSLAVAVGALWARASAPLIDPVETFERGGDPTNAYGGSADPRSLGLEFDFGLRYRLAMGEWGTVEARAEYGLFLFGEALAAADGTRPEPVHYGAGRVGAFW